jgi:hypothetical protein
MNNRIWILGTVIVSLGVMVLGFVLGIQPKLTEMTNNAADLAAAESQNAASLAELEALKVQYENIDEVRAELESLRQSLPADGDYPGFLAELEAAAQATGTTISSYSQTAAIVYGPAAVADASDPSAAPVNGGTLLGIPVSMSLANTDSAMLFDFLNRLRLGNRLFLLGDFSFASGDGSYTLSLSAHFFTLIDPNAVPADAVNASDPAAPEATPVPTDTATTPPDSTETPESTEEGTTTP